MKKFFKRLSIVTLLIILLEVTFGLYIGKQRLYDFKYKYSENQRINYLCDLDHLIDGVPIPNVEILSQNNVKIENPKGFNEGNCCTLVLSTKHFDFKLYNDGSQIIHNKINHKEIFYNGDQYYDGSYYNENEKNNKTVSKSTCHLIRKELNGKLTKIGREMNFQIYNYISSKYIKD